MLDILRDDLLTGLNATNKIVNTKSTLPSIGCVHIEANETNVVLSATDLETAVQLQVGAKVHDPFSVCVSSHRLSGILSARNEDVVNLKYDDPTVSLHVKTGRAKPVIQGIMSEEFPSLPDVESFRNQATVTNNFVTSQLLTALERVMFSASVNMSMPVYCSVLFRFGDNELNLISTDGYRMSVQSLAVKSQPCQFMVQSTALSKVVSLLRQFKSSEVEVCFTDNQVMFIGDSFYILCQLVEGNYPDTTPLEANLSLNYDTGFGVNSSLMKTAIKTGLNYDNDLINWKLTDNQLILTLDDLQAESFYEELEVFGKGEMKKLININFVNDIVKLSNGVIHFSTVGNHPAVYVFFGEDTKNYWLIMPIASK